MKTVLCAPGLKVTRKGLNRLILCHDVPLDDVLEALTVPGEVLKASAKGRVRRVNGWVLKDSQAGVILDTAKHTFSRGRYRRQWIAAHHLMSHGVLVPRPIAFVERRLMGVIFGNTMISEFLEGYQNVESFLAGLARHGAGQDTISLFLAGLADTVNGFTASGAYHSDLSGKNIFTRDGRSFVFIDLNAVDLNRDYTEELRLKNHVQLYDSFCDTLSDTMLFPFIQKMLPPGADARVWMPKVRQGQSERRRRLEARRERQGIALQE